MKFILLSNVATLAVLATAPGASAAGLRARANQHGGKDANADASTSTYQDETRGSSGRRNLYGRQNNVEHYYFPTETWHNGVQESPYMPDPNRDGTPYGMNIEGAPQGRSYAPYGLPSASNFGRPTQYEPQVKTGPGSVPVSEAVFSQYCKSLNDDDCSSTQGCRKYCAAKSAHVSEDVFAQYCKSLSDDECSSTQGCRKYCAAKSVHVTEDVFAEYCKSLSDDECSSTQGYSKYCPQKSDVDGHEWGHHNRNWFCGKIQTQDKCEQHDRDHQCGWDVHHDPPCHVY
jgi:hypothetical protein